MRFTLFFKHADVEAHAKQIYKKFYFEKLFINQNCRLKNHFKANEISTAVQL